MTRQHYKWEDQAKLGYHSLVKHKILRDYICAYVSTLTSNIKIDHFRLALVDGFAGGGKYIAEWNGETVYGSPFAMLDACHEAQAAGQALREKPFKLDTRFYFVEKSKEAHALLSTTLKDRGYGQHESSGNNIMLFHSDFEYSYKKIIADIQKHSTTARSIFLLDQYGYSEVPQDMVRHIFRQLPGAEVILTFNVDSLLTYLNRENLLAFHKKTGFQVEGLLESGLCDKEKRPKEWRLAAQAILHSNLVNGCFPDGVGHHTTFYIRAVSGHGDYWLVHLSRNLTARNVMVDIHWLHGNHFVHYGGSGLDMYCLRGFNVQAEADMFGFDEYAQDATQRNLQEQIPRLITNNHPNGITYRNLLAGQANYTPARDQDLRDILCNQGVRKELVILSPNGKRRRDRTAPENNDIIIPNPQKQIIF